MPLELRGWDLLLAPDQRVIRHKSLLVYDKVDLPYWRPLAPTRNLVCRDREYCSQLSFMKILKGFTKYSPETVGVHPSTNLTGVNLLYAPVEPTVVHTMDNVILPC